MARILVIEDTDENWQLMELLIRKAGHEAVHAADAERALQLLREQPVQLVFVDIFLPGMDGFELIRQIRDDQQLARGEYIAVTALAMEGDRERILQAGFDDYISKPIDVEAVYGRLCAIPGAGGDA